MRGAKVIIIIQSRRTGVNSIVCVSSFSDRTKKNRPIGGGGGLARFSLLSQNGATSATNAPHFTWQPDLTLYSFGEITVIFELFQKRIQIGFQLSELHKSLAETQMQLAPLYEMLRLQHEKIISERSIQCSVPIWHSKLFPVENNPIWISKASKLALEYTSSLIPQHRLDEAAATCLDSCGERECACNLVNELWQMRDGSKLVRSVLGTIVLPK